MSFITVNNIHYHIDKNKSIKDIYVDIFSRMPERRISEREKRMILTCIKMQLKVLDKDS